MPVLACICQRLDGRTNSTVPIWNRRARLMIEQQGVSRDIFRGAEKIEIMGKLPGLLWAYIDTSRKLLEDLKTRPDNASESVRTMQKMLEILHSAADHLQNEKLKDQLE